MASTHFKGPLILTIMLSIFANANSQPLNALIIDGQNNHGAWPKNTAMMKDYLEQTGMFKVDVERTAFTWQGPHSDASKGEEALVDLIPAYPVTDKRTISSEEPAEDPTYSPDFSKYDVIISNFGWRTAPWPKKAQEALDSYMKAGGGLVIVHAANNAFGDWPAYNKMIGVGGWGDRDEKSGPFLYYDDEGKLQRDKSKGPGGSHGRQMNFVVQMRDTSHPITKGLPEKWMHGTDELYDRLRGPAENITVLATAYSDVEENGPPWDKNVQGTGRHEPMLMTIKYGKGRVFHTTLGHNDASMESVGFIVTLQRGVEWAASGKVTQPVPEDFPRADEVSTRTWKK